MKRRTGKATLVLGMQYGDEGKGKIVDVLAQQADLVCRVQGGSNAGHTIQVGDKKYVTRLLPSGLFHPNCESAIGAGVVLDPIALREEIIALKKQGIELSPQRLHIDYRAHLVLPYHRHLDHTLEKERAGASTKIGTTGRGIGPTYASKAYREGPRMADLCTEDGFRMWLETYPRLKEHLEESGFDDFMEAGEFLRPYLKDVAMLACNRLAKGQHLLLEGAQGVMLDIGFGTYPYVTSSSLVAGSCAGGVGIPPWQISSVIGVTKTYSTRVGNGPYPGRIEGSFAEALRKKGNEYGTNTGRLRDVGWLDLVSLRYHACLNGLTSLAVMKADVLTGVEYIGLVTAYRDRRTGQEMVGYPMTTAAWERAEAVIEFVDGWDSLFSGKRLNPAYENFLNKVSKFINVPIQYISTGPERNEGLML